jgi:hypothetical protein
MPDGNAHARRVRANQYSTGRVAHCYHYASAKGHFYARVYSYDSHGNLHKDATAFADTRTHSNGDTASHLDQHARRG